MLFWFHKLFYILKIKMDEKKIVKCIKGWVLQVLGQTCFVFHRGKKTILCVLVHTVNGTNVLYVQGRMEFTVY